MPDRFVESHIRQLPMFQQLTPQQLDLVTKAFQILRFNRGELVVREGNATQGMFVLVSGEGVLTQRQANGAELRVGSIEANEVFNRDAVFREGAETVTLRVTQPAEVLFLSRNRMNTVLSYYPEVKQRLQVSRPTDGRATPSMNPLKTDTHMHAAQHEPPGERSNEEIILIRRRHPWSFIRRGWISVLILALFTGLAVALRLIGLPAALGGLIMGLGFVLAGLLMTYFYLEWRNDSFVITTTRVIRIERVIPTFSVSINEIPLDRIQAVDTDLPEGDIFARIFDYGNVELKNASDAGDMVLDTIPGPDEVQEAIFANQKQRREMADANKKNAIRAEIERVLGLSSTVQSEAQSVPQATANTSSLAVQKSGSPAPMRLINKDGDTVIRKHITIWLAAIIPPATMIVLAVVGLIFSFVSFGSLESVAVIGIIVSLVFLVIGGLWFWWADWDWRNDMYIIGDDRVTLIHQRPLWLQNEVDQILLSRVDNVFSEINGLFDTVFQRGDVRLSLVGEGLEKAKVFHKVHKPHEVQAEVSRRQARAKAQAEQDEDLRQREAIKEYLTAYHETVQGQQQTPPTASPPPTDTASGSDSDVGPYRAHDQNRPPGIPRRNRT